MACNTVVQDELEERLLGPRPSRLGTRRRGPRAVPAVSSLGASRRTAARSLDTEKYLETSVQDPAEKRALAGTTTCRSWAAGERTDEEVRAEKWLLKKRLTATVNAIYQEKARIRGIEDLERWFKALQSEKRLRPGESDLDRELRIATWLRVNPCPDRETNWWFCQYEQLRNCQAQWIGYRAACCGPATRPMAVPIGCRHRLCPLCCSHRAKDAKERIRTMFDELVNPVLITLTTPNQATIQKRDFKLFRKLVRAFYKRHAWKPATVSEAESGWIKGGVYALETTFNRAEKTWHIHCHMLADVVSPLPSKSERTRLGGKTVLSFTAMKLKLEFDWLRLTGSGWGKIPRKDADPKKKNGEIANFETWVRLGREMRLKEWSNGVLQPVQGISDAERALRTEWNRENRRVIDVRPVTDREKAVNEVLKYLTKVSNFSDMPSAVEPFMNAVHGARLIQTFGTWYGVKHDPLVKFDPENFEENWGEMKCSCGLNHWESMGVFYRSDVEMDALGRWQLGGHIEHTCRGTVPRPNIRVPETDLEESADEVWMQER
jgi:hypothetical protein